MGIGAGILGIGVAVACALGTVFGLIPLPDVEGDGRGEEARDARNMWGYVLLQVPAILLLIHVYMAVAYSFVFDTQFVALPSLLARFCIFSIPSGVLAVACVVFLTGLFPGTLLLAISIVLLVQRVLLQFSGVYTRSGTPLTQYSVLGGRYLDFQWVLLLLPYVPLVSTLFVFTAKVEFRPLWQSLAMLFHFLVLLSAHIFRVILMRPLQDRPYVLFPLAFQSDAVTDLAAAFVFPFATSWAPIATFVGLRLLLVVAFVVIGFTSAGVGFRSWILQTRRDRGSALAQYRSQQALLGFRMRTAHYIFFTASSWTLSSSIYVLMALLLRSSDAFFISRLPSAFYRSSIAVAVLIALLSLAVLLAFSISLSRQLLADVASTLRIAWYLAALSYITAGVVLLTLFQSHSCIWPSIVSSHSLDDFFVHQTPLFDLL